MGRGTNRRVSYKLHEEIDKGRSKIASSPADYANGLETKNNQSDNRRLSFLANGGAARNMVPTQEDDNPAKRRASFLGQQDLEAIRRASAASQDIVMRLQNELAAGNMTHPAMAAAQKIGMVVAPHGGYQDSNEIGYPNRRVSFVSPHDLDFARRSSIASLNDALIKQNILGYSDAGPNGRQGSIASQQVNMSGLPFLSQHIDGHRGNLLAQELLLQNQLLGGVDGNGHRGSTALQNRLAMMQQQGNQNIAGITEEDLQNRRLSFQSSQNLGNLHHANTNSNVVSDIPLPPKRGGQEALIEGSVMIPGVGNRRVSMTAEQFNALQAAQGNPGIETKPNNNLGGQAQKSSNQNKFTPL